MEKEYNNILNQLKSGEKVYCPKCHKGYFTPFNETADKAHSFYCSNESCDCNFHFDTIIDIE